MLIDMWDNGKFRIMKSGKWYIPMINTPWWIERLFNTKEEAEQFISDFLYDKY